MLQSVDPFVGPGHCSSFTACGPLRSLLATARERPAFELGSDRSWRPGDPERQLGRPQDPLCEGGEAFLQGPASDDLGAGDDDPPVPDRKSTRLNSSHGYISYAVFCLKKKKTLQMNVT